MKNAKTAEARNSIGQIAKDAASAYSREKMAAGVMATGSSTAVANELCQAASATVPDDIAKVAAMKYQSSPAEWAPKDEAANIGWTCLKFSMDQPQYYLYNYTNDPATSFKAIAKGNLDGDTESSTFTLEGAVQDGTVAISPSIQEENAEE
jgi:type IV pilus assembly protein PilA